MIVINNIDFMGGGTDCFSRKLILSRSKYYCQFFRILKGSLDFGDIQFGFDE